MAAIAVAIILAEMRHKIKKFYQSAILLPYILSMVIVSYLVFAFLSTENGFINSTILPLLGKERISWYLYLIHIFHLFFCDNLPCLFAAVCGKNGINSEYKMCIRDSSEGQR